MNDKKKPKVEGVTRSDYFKLLEKVSKPVKPDKEKKPGKAKDKT